MAHKRKEIREKIKALLTGATAAGTRVFEMRVRDLSEDDLPAIAIYSEEESAEIYVHSPLEYKRTLRLRIDAIHSLSDDVEDQLDLLSNQIESVLDMQDTLGDLVSSFVYAGTDLRTREGGQEDVGSARLFYVAEYLTGAGATVEDDLEEVNVKYDFGPPDEQIEAHDSITLPT